ncbi:cytochrome c oxidase subunit II [Brumimicrobium aurantiacum]|uniref:cytochrome-c oxidase n=1 Tax=Brumimicrobium aurantiacum TaxID=1737063 RepID=A0A3E1F1U0_9FLAO|nr:cytochrome c oxidase subunit II [Brumimicrobium aurantiacum]RFC55776.1 cytochrome c oxidase subunit II [Brumimicrobium aurantiacum]
MDSKLIIILVIILGVLAIAQLIRVNELTRKRNKLKEEDIPKVENKFNANMMLVFMVALYAGFVYLIVKFGDVHLGPAASAHGQEIDWLYNVNWFIVISVFLLTNTLLFVFAWKYSRKEGVKAYYYAHNNKLEMVWTVIPAAVLSIIIILGLRTWNETTSKAGAEFEDIEIFAYQFAWTARYSGMNNELGKFDYKLTTAENPYGIMTKDNIERSLSLMKVGAPGQEGVKMLEEKLNDRSIIMSAQDRSDLEDQLGRKERMSRMLEAMSITYNDSLDELANDDVILEDSLVLLKGQKYNFSFRSKDVIHSAYFPHFRAQMNTVPGMTTYFKFQPIYSSDEMKEKLDDPEFEYALLCNKICGGSHYKMKMSVKVLEPEEYLAWQKTKSTYDGTPWVEDDEAEMLEYYQSISNRVVEN